jgi:hypothetical protein
VLGDDRHRLTPPPPPPASSPSPSPSPYPLSSPSPYPALPRIVLRRRTYHPFTHACLCSVHGNVRLWTLSGVMIGTFGQGRTLTKARTPWRLNDESTYYCLEPLSPLSEEELYEQEQQRLRYSSDYLLHTLCTNLYEQEQLDLYARGTPPYPLIDTP